MLDVSRDAGNRSALHHAPRAATGLLSCRRVLCTLLFAVAISTSAFACLGCSGRTEEPKPESIQASANGDSSSERDEFIVLDGSAGSDSENQNATGDQAVDPSLSGWVTGSDGVARYYDEDTHKPHSGWLDQGDDRFYCDADGAMHVGWLELEGKGYWLSDGRDESIAKGTLARDRWLRLDDKTYHIEPDGSASEGWCTIDEQTYCFDDVGAMRTGWAKGEDGRRRWLKTEDGTMATHEWVKVDDFWEPFDDDGSWVTNGETIPPNDAEDMASLSDRQRAVITACDNTPWPGGGLCAGWVSSVFATAGEPEVGGDACDMANAWCTSSDLSQLKPGMIIAVPTHSRTENGKIWGHVCVYVGGGIVRDSGSYGIRRIHLGSWLAWFGVDVAPQWGWANGIALA